MTRFLRQLTEHAVFQTAIIVIIVAAGVIVGLQSDPDIEGRHGALLRRLDQIILILFTVEIALRIGAEGRQPWRYFYSGWNVFDFAIVAVCYLPLGGEFLTILRLARLLRVVRLIHFLPRLQVLVNAMLKSIPSMGYVSLLLGLVFYVYGVMGVFLFAANDPVHFGDLGRSLLTLFRVVTLEDWTDVMYTQLFGCASFGYGMSEELCTSPEARPVAAVLY
ncbi:MAG: ion transporter, partial [Myxococcota bacterium]